MAKKEKTVSSVFFNGILNENLFGDAAIGEYFRVFISYGVIALALVMHAWSGATKKKKQQAAA